MQKILIIRFSSIGDIVLTTPIVRCLKQQLNAEIHYLTKSTYQDILLSNPYIDKVWAMSNNLKELFPALQAQQFDRIIDLHHNLRTLRVKLHLGVPSASFPKLNIEKWLLTNFNINRLPDVHIVNRYFETVQPLGVKNNDLGLDYFIPVNEVVHVSEYGFKREEYIAFAIGAKYATKRLPVEKIIQICRQIPYTVVLLGGKEDYEHGQQIVQSTDKLVLNACGQFSLHGSASWVQQARLLITHDTGLMHIGAAFKKPIISIWGNTVPAFGMYPYQTDYQVIETKNLNCRPCSKIGHQQCPKQHFKCMQEIDLDDISRKVMEYWNLGNG